MHTFNVNFYVILGKKMCSNLYIELTISFAITITSFETIP